MKYVLTSGSCINDGHRQYQEGDIIDLFPAEAQRLLKMGKIKGYDGEQDFFEAGSVDAAVKMDQILDAITALDKTVPDNWTKSKKPQVSALEKLLPFEITATERDNAWNQYNINQQVTV